MSALKNPPPPPPTHDQLNAQMTAYGESLGVRMQGLVMSCCPAQCAPMMFVGFRHLPGEIHPFDAPHRAILITMLQRLNIEPHMAFITDLVKAPLSGEIAANILSRWNDFLFQQITLVQPKAVVLLGTDTAAAVLRITRSSVEDYRHRRVVWPQRTRTNFFVTCGPDDLADEMLLGGGRGLLGTAGIGMHEDIRAVAEADVHYFDRIVPIGGFSKE